MLPSISQAQLTKNQLAQIQQEATWRRKEALDRWREEEAQRAAANERREGLLKVAQQVRSGNADDNDAMARRF